MAITTDSYIDVISGGITYDRIGLSKTLNNYTFNDLFENAYCGQYDISRLNNHLSENDVSFTSGNNLWNYSVTYSNNKWSEGGDVANYSDPDGLYGKVIWLQCNSTFDNSVTVSNFNKYKLVTEWDAPKYCADAPSLNAGPCSASLVPPNWNTDKPFPAIYYAPGDIVLAYRSHLTFPDDVSIEIQGIRPYMICKFNNVGFIYKFDMNEGMHYFYGANEYYGSPDMFAVGGITSFDTTYSLAEAMSCDYMSPQLSGYDFSGYPNDSVFPLTLPLGSTGTTNKGMISSDQRYIVKLTTGGTYVGMYAGVEFRSYFTRRHDALMFFANMGIKFYAGPAGKHYKPIIENGIVVDFSENLNEPSELDNWTGSTAHDVPDAPTPPIPPIPEGDDIDPNSFGGGSKLGGVDNLWLLTAQQLSDLHTAFNNNNDPNFEPLNSIISVLGLAISPLYIFGDDISTVTNIKIKKADGTSWSSGVNGHICSSQVSSFGLTGNISIQRKYNNFLDYPPYASHEMFIPLCGWVPLPSCCIGRSLSVYYVPDIQTGGVRGLVLCDGCIVAEKYGILGANIPFTSNGHGLMLGGIISGGVQTLADFATAMGGLATGNAMATVYGGSSFFSDGFNMALAANQNRTSVIGQNQDRTGFSDGTYIRIKSVYQDVKIDPLFGHTIGYMCHESGQLSDFHGFTVCENPHIHISSTSAEKEEIKRLLEEGVILPAPSE